MTLEPILYPVVRDLPNSSPVKAKPLHPQLHGSAEQQHLAMSKLDLADQETEPATPSTPHVLTPTFPNSPYDSINKVSYNPEEQLACQIIRKNGVVKTVTMKKGDTLKLKPGEKLAPNQDPRLRVEIAEPRRHVGRRRADQYPMGTNGAGYNQARDRGVHPMRAGGATTASGTSPTNGGSASDGATTTTSTRSRPPGLGASGPPPQPTVLRRRVAVQRPVHVVDQYPTSYYYGRGYCHHGGYYGGGYYQGGAYHGPAYPGYYDPYPDALVGGMALGFGLGMLL